MVVLTAYATLLPNKINDALEACRIVRSHSVIEPGCERYDYFQSPDDATKIVFVEEWTTKGHLDTHFEQAAFQNFMAVMTDFVSAPSEVRIFESSLIE